MLRVLSVALPVLALVSFGAGSIVSTPVLASVLCVGGLAIATAAIVLHFVGMRTYDPYKGRRHSAD